MFNPQGQDSRHLDVFKNLVCKDLEDLRIKNVRDSHHIKKGIKSLELRNDIVIRPADKGGGLVVLSKTYYQEEMTRLLSDSDTYLLLRGDPMVHFKNELHSLVEKGKQEGVLNKKKSSYLDPFYCRTPIIYFLPKLHKNSERPPGRPIVNGIDSVTSRLGQYLDYFLQPLVSKMEAYLRDTKQVIQILDTLTCTQDTILVTADVGSLYTIIDHEAAIASIVWALKDTDLNSQHVQFILDGLNFCLLKNYFWYNKNFYLQQRGVAMGARFAPSVANLFMAHWEEETVFGNRPPQLLCYKQYIDDLIMVWEGDRISLQHFMDRLNANSKNIVLTWTVSCEKIAFLDLEIFKSDNHLLTRNFFKVTDRNGYIPLSSCHHRLWLCNIPRGQFVRLRRNCTIEADFLTQSQVLAQRFVQKGYSTSDIDQEIERVRLMDRDVIIADKPCDPTVIEANINHKILLDYNIQHKKFERIIVKHWAVLKGDTVLGPVLPERPQFVYKKAPALRDLIAPGVIDPPIIPRPRLFNFLSGFYACGRCATCKHVKNNIKKRKQFSSTVTRTEYTIKQLVTCDTEGVIYMLECECGLQYVGRTSRALHIRVGEHISCIKRGVRTHSVSKHFRQYHDRNPKGLKFWGIEKVSKHWRGGHFIRQLSRRESYWIYELKVASPRGLNVEFDLNCFISNR